MTAHLASRRDGGTTKRQRTGGLRSVLSLPWAFRAYQRAVGAQAYKRALVATHLRPRPGDRLLDIGCGPGDIVEELRGVEYVGLDVSERYIEHARARFGTRGSFLAVDVIDADAGALGEFDLAYAHGLLHHLSDTVASRVCALAAAVLVPSGTFVTADPCFHPDQSRMARLTVAWDRGQAVRTPNGYRVLAEHSFERVDVLVDHSPLRIPHTTAVLVCTTPKPRSERAEDARPSRNELR
jgi:SAM-dependent methyltransferase